MAHIVFTKPDNTVGIIIPSPEWQGTLAELAEKDVPAGMAWQIMEDLPVIAGNYPKRQRTYRNAWRADADGVTVDMEAARAIHAANILRKAKAEGVEVVMPDLTTATTQTELYAIWPQPIKKRG